MGTFRFQAACDAVGGIFQFVDGGLHDFCGLRPDRAAGVQDAGNRGDRNTGFRGDVFNG